VGIGKKGALGLCKARIIAQTGRMRRHAV